MVLLIPPTAVGGISDLSSVCSFCRRGMNHPPTAVGGILSFDTLSAVGGVGL